jgi:hypothetical protein
MDINATLAILEDELKETARVRKWSKLVAVKEQQKLEKQKRDGTGGGYPPWRYK